MELTKDFIGKNALPCLEPKGTPREGATVSFMDMQMFFSIPIETNEEGKIARVILGHQILSEAGITMAELMAYACANAERLFRVTSLSEMMGFPCLNENAEPFLIADGGPQHMGDGTGAGIVFCAVNKLKEFAQQRGLKALTLIPSSRHEILILNPEIKPEEAGGVNPIIQEVNREACATIDVLSDHTYTFDPESGVFSY